MCHLSAGRLRHTVFDATGDTAMFAFIADITFTEICLALIATGMVEHVAARLPEGFADPRGWL